MKSKPKGARYRNLILVGLFLAGCASADIPAGPRTNRTRTLCDTDKTAIMQTEQTESPATGGDDAQIVITCVPRGDPEPPKLEPTQEK